MSTATCVTHAMRVLGNVAACTRCDTTRPLHEAHIRRLTRTLTETMPDNAAKAGWTLVEEVAWLHTVGTIELGIAADRAYATILAAR